MIKFVLFSVSRGWQGFWRNAFMSLAATATMTLMLILLAGFWIIQSGLLAGLQFVEQKVEVVADLADDASLAEIGRLRASLDLMPQVAGVNYVSRDEALQRFRAQLEQQGETDLTAYLDGNPLRASLEVRLSDPEDYRAVIERLRAEPLVTTVKDVGNLVERVLTVTNMLRTAGGVVLAIVAVIVLFIIINSIRLAVLARADEIEIMRLVGASDAFIRWPFVFEGALVGILGAAITLGLLGLAADPIRLVLFDFFRVLPLQIGSLTRDLVVLVVGAGVGLGVVGSWVSVRTYLIR
jgi:cell division transport system permease protein